MPKVTGIDGGLREDFEDLLTASLQIARDLWDNDADSVWDTV